MITGKRIFLTAALIAAILFCRADELLDKARNNDVLSQLQIAGEYFYGKKRPLNLPMAYFWFRKAAQSGLPEAQYNLGQCLKNGWGCEKNPAGAFYFFGMAKDRQLKKAVRAYAEMLFSGVEEGTWEELKFPEIKPDRHEALELMRQLAATGSDEDLMLFAKYLFNDPEDHGRELRELLKKYVSDSSDPDPEALVIYAACLRSGIGGFVPDPAAGAEILRRAADKKYPEAIAQLAEMNFFGFGMPVNRKLAMELYTEAVKLGSPRAMTEYAQMKLSGIYLPEDIPGAFKLLSAAAEKKYPPAIKKLADCHISGIGTPVNIPLGMELYLEAAKAGDAKAAFRLGEIFQDGSTGNKNPERAFYFFLQSALSGHVPGMREAAKAMLEGNGTPVDYNRGILLMRRAAEMGDPEASALLQ